MKLSDLKPTVLSDPLRFLLYGGPGVGKTTTAAHAPSPIILDIEDGSGRVNVARYPFNVDGSPPTRLDQVTTAITELTTEPHDFRTVIIDTLDRLETLIFDKIVAQFSGKKDDAVNKSGRVVKSIDGFPFQGGHKVSVQEWRELCFSLDELRKRRGMNVVLIGHSQVKHFKNPQGEDYDRYEMSVYKGTAGLLYGWSDFVGFCAHEQGVKTDDAGKHGKGFSTGRRLVHTEHTAAYDAKTRIPMPPEIELDVANPWAGIQVAINAGANISRADLFRAIGIQLENIKDPDLIEKVRAGINEKTPMAILSRCLNKLKTINAEGAS